MDAGHWYLPDAPDGQRETPVTNGIDAEPIQIQRVTGPTWITHVAAFFTGGAFIFLTFQLYWPAAICGLLAGLAIIWWLWTATVRPPARPEKDAGLGLTLPTYVSGPAACSASSPRATTPIFVASPATGIS